MSYMREYVDRIEWYYSERMQILHRIDGPAIEWKNGDMDWVVYGMCCISEDNYKMSTSNIPLLLWNRFRQGLCI